MADIVITGRDYANFSTTFSDLNIIRSATGGEYFVDGASAVSFNIEANSIVNENGEVYPEQHFVDGMPSEFGGFFAKTENRVFGAVSFSFRKELGYLSGSIKAHTSDVIYDINSIGVDVQVQYNRYQKKANDILYKYNAYENTFVYSLIYDGANLSDENKDLQADNSLPNDPVRYWEKHYFQPKYSEFNLDNKQYISKPRILSVSEEGTTVQIDFKLLVWSGHNDVTEHILFIIENTLFLDVATKITLSVKASTVETEENKFDYVSADSQSFNTDEAYELESNELLQYTKDQPIEERMSYNLSSKIFDKTNINRQIVSFDLLKVEKYTFIDNSGNEISRYLQSRDKIKIKDEKGQWLGTYNDANGNEVVPYFEVVKCENRWNGKFYKHIVCKQAIE